MCRGVCCNEDGTIRSVHLSDNNLHGSLPASFFRVLHQGISFDLRGNRLGGSLPTELGLLREAPVGAQLKLNTNPFSGTLPTQLGTLTASTFDITQTWISGTLPTELFGPTSSISYFYAQGWKDMEGGVISGTLPSELAQMGPALHIPRDV